VETRVRIRLGLSQNPQLEAAIAGAGEAAELGVRRRRWRAFYLEKQLVEVAPPPVLARFVGPDERVIRVLVPVGSGVAARGLSQKPAWPQRIHRRRWTHSRPLRGQSSRPPLDVMTSARASRCEQRSAMKVSQFRTRGEVPSHFRRFAPEVQHDEMETGRVRGRHAWSDKHFQQPARGTPVTGG